MPRLAGVAFALASFASAASASALPPVYDAWATDGHVASNVDPTVDDANRVRPPFLFLGPALFYRRTRRSDDEKNDNNRTARPSLLPLFFATVFFCLLSRRLADLPTSPPKPPLSHQQWVVKFKATPSDHDVTARSKIDAMCAEAAGEPGSQINRRFKGRCVNRRSMTVRP
jgi:hypothetical protein